MIDSIVIIRNYSKQFMIASILILCNYSAVLYADLPYGLGLAEWDEKAPTEAELVKLLRGYLYLKPDQRMLLRGHVG